MADKVLIDPESWCVACKKIRDDRPTPAVKMDSPLTPSGTARLDLAIARRGEFVFHS